MNEVWKERLRRFAPKAGYPVFYLFCLLVFLSWTFPYDALKERIVTTFNAQQHASQSPQELSIDELDSWFFPGIRAKGVRLVSPSNDPQKRAVEIMFDVVRLRVSLLPLLVGTKNVSFSIDAFDGSAKGNFEDSSKARVVDVTFDGVDISKVDAIAANIGFPLEGKLSGTLKLDLPEGKASKGNGNVNLEIHDMVAGNAKELTIKMPTGPVSLPRLKVGTFTATGEAKDGVLRLSKIGASGGDVDVTGDGRVLLRDIATDAHLDVSLKLKINDSYRSKDEKTKSLFGTPGSNDKPLIEMDPKVARSKTADGYYSLRVGGTLGRPDVQPAAAAPYPVPPPPRTP
ncbi:MAG: type II secretion system protein GspN [Polyangiaceae bacterium]|nr:type II secretion system protein GspN [Polyangiaceae bacterium]